MATSERKKSCSLFLLLDSESLRNHKIWNAEDAEDVVQNALAVIAREFRDIEISVSFLAWAYKVLDNKLLSYIKKKKGVRYSLENSPGNPDVVGHSSDLAFRIRLLDCARKVRAANAKYARAVVLHYQGYTTAEICEALKVSPPNFYMILSRARAMLRQCLESGSVE